MVNKSEAVYNEIYKFIEFKGMEVVSKHEGMFVKYTVHPGKNKAVVIRVNAIGGVCSLATINQVL